MKIFRIAGKLYAVNPTSTGKHSPSEALRIIKAEIKNAGIPRTYVENITEYTEDKKGTVLVSCAGKDGEDDYKYGGESAARFEALAPKIAKKLKGWKYDGNTGAGIGSAEYEFVMK